MSKIEKETKESINSGEFISKVHKHLVASRKAEDHKGPEISEKNVGLVLRAFSEVLGSNLAERKEVRLSGLGIFSPKHRSASTGRNPRTGEAMEIPAVWKVNFKAAKSIRDTMNPEEGKPAAKKTSQK